LFIVQLGNVDASRVATRISNDGNINVLNILLLTLPGTSFVYYGEELGMKDIKVDPESCKSVVRRKLVIQSRYQQKTVTFVDGFDFFQSQFF